MKIAVGITGASGAIYARLMLKKIGQMGDRITEAGVVWSANARTVWNEELEQPLPDLSRFKTWENNDFYAPIASGSARYDALILCPCSMGTLGRIATGVSDNLITRAADVMLKERRKLICVVREAPYNLIHLENMKTVTLAGGIICPASPAYYQKPQSLEAAAETVVDRVLTLCGLPTGGFEWGK